jgi:hypothetical protein
MATCSHADEGHCRHEVLPRRIRRVIRRKAAAVGRLVAVEAERRAREALTATAADLHAAGRPPGDIIDELVDAE